MIVYRYAEGPPRRVAGTSYTRSSTALPSRVPIVPTFKYTHYTFIRALNTSRIDGIERCTRIYICVFPSSSPCSSLRASLDTLCPPFSTLPYLHFYISLSLLPLPFPSLSPLSSPSPCKANRPPSQRSPPTLVLCRKSHARLVSVCL